MTVPLQGVMENDLVGTMQGQWQHQARVEWSHREGAVFHWRQQSSAFQFNGIFILTAWQSQPEICDVPSADVAICVQFLFVSVAVPPFNPSFTFPLCSELPLYFLAALFSAYSWSTASHSFLHWKARHCLAWLSSQKPTTWLLNVSKASLRVLLNQIQRKQRSVAKTQGYLSFLPAESYQLPDGAGA